MGFKYFILFKLMFMNEIKFNLSLSLSLSHTHTHSHTLIHTHTHTQRTTISIHRVTVWLGSI